MQKSTTTQTTAFEQTESFQILLNHLRETEGLRLRSYQDVAGVWTIGYGHTHGVRAGMAITKDVAETTLRQDVLDVYIPLSGLVSGLNEWQMIALIDFCFNFNVERFKRSTLYTAIVSNKGNAEISRQFRRWIYCKSCGRKIPSTGLIKRREWEVKMWTHKL